MIGSCGCKISEMKWNETKLENDQMYLRPYIVKPFDGEIKCHLMMIHVLFGV